MSPQIEQKPASEELTQKFKEILKDNGIPHEVKSVVITEPPELVGEHMATATVYAKVEFQDVNVPSKNLFVKKFTSNAVHTQWVKEMRIMEKEAMFYNKFLPALREFCKKFNGCENLLPFFPKMFFGDDEMVVLENLVLDDSYFMLSKEDKQDLFTAKYVLSNLAKFHASTFAFIEDTGRDAFKANWELVCFETFLRDVPLPMMKSMYDNGLNNCINLLKGHPVEGDEETIETIKGLIGKAYQLVCGIVKNKPESKLLVINHGDCWNNNMLFKKDPQTGKVNDHIFVDLQITRFGSPNLDLGYFLYTSVKPKVRRAHLKELLQHYYDTLSKTLESFKKTMPLTFDEFFEDYKVKSQMGFLFNVTIMSGGGALKDIDMEKLPQDNPDAMMEAFLKAIDNWVKNNPEESAEISKEIVAVFREYKTLLPSV